MIKGQKRLLLALAILGDIFEDLVDAGGLMSFSYQQIYGYMPQKYKKHNFEMTMRRALKVGSIRKRIKKGQACLELTSRGKNQLTEFLPLSKFQRKKWDRKWRVVFFDIEEKNKKQREHFRRKLCNLGFAQFQRSVYISPFPIEKEMREFIESLGLKDKAYLLISPRFLAGDEKDLVRRIWNLDRINEKYSKVLNKIEEGEIDEKKQQEIKSLYLEILSVDPFLPVELLPKDWLRQKVEKKIRQLRD